ncbi:hypothetical protein [Mucilaginibacter agri]|uniref:Uncharacterized protein n=1 Tax=Mucilaginibacter agri TaxID=2695265 RepID=A0A965ZGG4_9SPHI|nr:hypothetical protein [Mucilaginibacter agri]NCD69627.1 hypothetical protein [Mucilaginibacter agri]
MPVNKNIKQLIIWALLTNMLILVGLGNGTGFMVIVEAILLPLILKSGLYFALTDSYTQLLPTAALFSLVGQVFLVLGFFKKRGLTQGTLTFIGLLLMYAGLAYLTANAKNDNESLTGLVTAVPFACVSVLLLYHIVSSNAYRFDELLRGDGSYTP